MGHLHFSFKIVLNWIAALIVLTSVSSCSHDEDVRMPNDLVGVWSPYMTRYMEFKENYYVYNLEILHQDGMSIGRDVIDAYIYEPGYHLVIYLRANKVDVYQIVNLTSVEMTWCWVKQIVMEENSNKNEIGHLIGDIIKEAQEGFNLNPEHYETFRKIPQDEFFSILEDLNIFYPW